MDTTKDPATKVTTETYFRHFDNRMPPHFPAMKDWQESLWHLLAGLCIGLGVWYLHWRWTSSLNPDAMAFSVLIVGAETLAFLGLVLFFFDIWKEGDTPRKEPPATRQDAGLEGDGPIHIDVFLTTCDESAALLEASIQALKTLRVPRNMQLHTYLLDDGNRAEIAQLAQSHGVEYLTRKNNIGFKAGNLRNALFKTNGDFVVILDADTRVLPTMLENTLGYFRDPKVAWVQTPHWFYDVPGETKGSKLKDPFMANPNVFFDVIQRRRNRDHASFCCGAGSIHRREAIFHDALRQLGKDMDAYQKFLPETKDRAKASLRATPAQPFRFHVSEDIFTSILMHSDPQSGWKSVYHPQAEARMLSPWSVEAWTSQRLKYAGGTFDIMLNANPLWRKGMPLKTKLHYAATFWSYLSILWLSVLLMAPVLSLFTGVAPVNAYSLDFFLHLLPPLIMAEVATMVGCKGYNTTAGRLVTIGCLPLQWKALWLVLRGRKPRFPPTPKVPGLAGAAKRLIPNFIVLAIMAAAAVFGIIATLLELPGYTPSKTIVNIFWCSWNAFAVWMVVRLYWWSPEAELQAVRAT
ncbi:glycosyltransferase family 2 protein [Actibacterium pelagium]|uniref:Glycosyltransferase 2-like domain-containing protein n=1 Tax=Actibacterium pelagium TaxID=2029103 RepID=A0A917EJR8_9RHOB|nr:cellulose synthase catalytic subunit [Actibacterium pelagium]GGE54177.1 hypothetical protein GCM10011517_22220 [Actibacterium pelagium]